MQLTSGQEVTITTDYAKAGNSGLIAMRYVAEEEARPGLRFYWTGLPKTLWLCIGQGLGRNLHSSQLVRDGNHAREPGIVVNDIRYDHFSTRRHRQKEWQFPGMDTPQHAPSLHILHNCQFAGQLAVLNHSQFLVSADACCCHTCW